MGRRLPGRPGTRDLTVGAQAIVHDACELLREVSPRELSLIRLARFAGIDRSLIRYYFRDRSSLLLAAARHLFARLKSRLDAAEVALADDPVAQIREFATVLLSFQIEHPYFHRLMIEEVVNAPNKEAQAFFRSVTEQGARTFRNLATAGERRGLTRAYDGLFLYLAVIGMCEFFVTGGPILKVAIGEDFDVAGANRRYQEFLRDYVIDGIRRR
jgi:AcrR family transcriptional regulator